MTSTTPNSNIPAVIAEPKPVYTRSSPSTPTDRIIESEVVQIDEVVPSHNDSLPIHDDAAGIIDVIYEFELDVCANVWHSDNKLTVIIRTATGRTRILMKQAHHLRNRTMCAIAARFPAELSLTLLTPTRCRKTDWLTRRDENAGGYGCSGSRRRQRLVGKVFGEPPRRHALESGKEGL